MIPNRRVKFTDIYFGIINLYAHTLLGVKTRKCVRVIKAPVCPFTQSYNFFYIFALAYQSYSSLVGFNCFI